MQEFGSNLGRYTGYPDLVFRGFPQSLQANSRITPLLRHDRFLPNPFQLFTRLSFYHSALYILHTESVVK
jgi:hypothetical protein